MRFSPASPARCALGSPAPGPADATIGSGPGSTSRHNREARSLSWAAGPEANDQAFRSRKHAVAPRLGPTFGLLAVRSDRADGSQRYPSLTGAALPAQRRVSADIKPI